MNNQRQNKRAKKLVLRIVQRFPFYLGFISVVLLIVNLGFDIHPNNVELFEFFHVLTVFFGTISLSGRYFSSNGRPGIKVWPYDSILFIYFILNIFIYAGLFSMELDQRQTWLYLATFFVFVRELFALNIDFKKQYLNPAQLFILSFILIILAGTGVLMLPNATYTGISFIDALFTTTSAVCVTGLAVVDTGSYFTDFGLITITLLIQVGGLGIMTFTSYFSYFFRGGSSFENQLLIKDMTTSEKMAEVFSTLKKIILLTLIIEGAGVLFIYWSLDDPNLKTFGDRLFFSIFHSVSGFCNAGFSTLPNSFYDLGYRFNYPLHLTLSALFVIGGIGFPIMFNSYKYLKHLIVNKALPMSRRTKTIHIPWVININTKIVIITSVILTVAGTIFIYFSEYNNTLVEHSGFGKIVTAFFSAVTPRTAGFNTVDTSALHFSTIMIIFLLMWIGASPASTGGGIKTSTFAIGTLNFLSLARGKDRIELFNREIAEVTIRRAFAIISLSFVVIGASVFFIASFDSDKDLLPIAFECFSAYSTVGLSLGITATLSSASKMVIILTMFVGRISMLTLLIAVFRKVMYLKYRFPKEEILIN